MGESLPQLTMETAFAVPSSPGERARHWLAQSASKILDGRMAQEADVLVARARRFQQEWQRRLASDPQGHRLLQGYRGVGKALKLGNDLLRGDRLVVRRVVGRVAGPSGTAASVSIGYVGRAQFHADFLAAFGDKRKVDLVEEQELYAGSLFGLIGRSAAVERALVACDVTVRERFLPDADGDAGFVFHPYLRAKLPIRESVEGHLSSVKSKSYANKLRKALRSKIRWRTTSDDVDFDLFYERMYAPHARHRYGDRCHLLGKEELRRFCRASGVLLLVEQDVVGGARPLGGAILCESSSEPDSLVYFRNGVMDSPSLSSMELGDRSTALDLAVIEYGIHTRYKWIDYDLTPAWLADGVFTHKRRIGCLFESAPYSPDFGVHIAPHRRAEILARMPMLGLRRGAVEAWLGHHAADGSRSLSEWNSWIRNFWVPGCRRLLIHASGVSSTERAPILGTLRAAIDDPATEIVWQETCADDVIAA